MKLFEKVYNNPHKTKATDITIVMSNTKYLASPIPTQQLKAGNSMFQYKRIGKVPQERNDDTLTYDPDQPRVPAGSSEGGQWTDSGGSRGSSNKESNSNASKSSLLSDPNSLNEFNKYLSNKDEVDNRIIDKEKINDIKTAKYNIFKAEFDGEDFVENTRKYIGSTDWIKSKQKGNFKEGTDKCNLFVAEMLIAYGNEVPMINGIFSHNYPIANQWGDRNLKIDGYEVVDDPMPGDIIAFKSPPWYSGHVGIVSRNGMYISARTDAVEEIKYKPIDEYKIFFEDIVFRRYVNK